MEKWLVPVVIIMVSNIVAFLFTPADPLSYYIGWFLLSVLTLGCYGLGWWVRGRMRP